MPACVEFNASRGRVAPLSIPPRHGVIIELFMLIGCQGMIAKHSNCRLSEKHGAALVTLGRLGFLENFCFSFTPLVKGTSQMDRDDSLMACSGIVFVLRRYAAWESLASITCWWSTSLAELALSSTWTYLSQPLVFSLGVSAFPEDWLS